MKGFGEKNKQIKNLNIQQTIKIAFQLHSEGKLFEAEKYYLYLLNKGLNDHRVFSNYGVILKSFGKLNEAEISYRKAIKLKPDYVEAHSNLGNILKDLNRLEEAEIAYREAIRINPNYANTNLNLGIILLNQRNLKEAEFFTREAIRINPNYAKAHLNMGMIMHNLSNLKEAEFSYREAIRINPNYSKAYLNLGSILINLGNLKEAEAIYRKVIQINPNYSKAYLNLGSILIDQGNLEELIKLSKSILKSNSFNKGYKLLASLRITIAYLLKGDFTETFSSIDKTNKLIKQGAIKIIKEENYRKYALNFSTFINALFPLLEKEKIYSNLDKIPHFGESHSLSFAHQTIKISTEFLQIQPVLITGAKAWHFSTKKNNQWKTSLKHQIKDHTYCSRALISFGEIDCRKDEGILNYSDKNNKNISDVCERTIQGFLDYMEKILSPYYSKRYYFGIPAPINKTKIPDELDVKRVHLVKSYNKYLKKEVLSRGAYFLDIYAFTSNKYGENNKLHMCDTYHLSPQCLTDLFKNHLCKA